MFYLNKLYAHVFTSQPYGKENRTRNFPHACIRPEKQESTSRVVLEEIKTNKVRNNM